MAKKRLALVACKYAAEGPWTLAKQNEIGLNVIGLGLGESVVLEVQDGVLSERFVYGKVGNYDWPKSKFVVDRYRIIKEVGEDDDVFTPQSTTVEVYLSD